VKVYEAKHILVPELDEMSDEEIENILNAFDELVEVEKQLDTDDEEDDEDDDTDHLSDERDDLDRAIMNAIGFEDSIEHVKKAVDGLLKLREREAGESTEVLVEEVEDETEVIDLAGVSEVQESTTLDQF
jgi:hypothetical protein